MEPESDNVGSQDAADVSSRLPSSGKNKDTANPSTPVNGGELENASTAPSNVEGAEKSTGIHYKGQQFQKRGPGKLRARSKAFKKSFASKSLEAKNAKATPEANGGLGKGNKTPLQRNNKDSNKREHVDLKETPADENRGKSQANGGFRKGNKTSLQRDNKESNKREHVDLKEIPAEGNTGKNHKEEMHVEKNKEIQKNNDRTLGTRKRHKKLRNENKRGRFEGTSKNQIDKKKSDMKDMRQQDEGRKEKLGGLILMCNAKTKPDCFRYRVMGVSMPKKDIVLSVKRGLKLFLYDFDLKLLYGIYEASSSGGMRLEPKAFGGGFPVQIRFSVYKDCFPLSESVFKKAIQDNYYERNKFRTELTVRQVRKLSQLFRPVVSQHLQAVAVPLHPSAIGSVRDRELYRGVRDSGCHKDREVLAISSDDGRGHPLLPHEMDWHAEHREGVHMRRQEMPRNLYMNEREYRTYGLQGERRSLTASQSVESALDPYITDRQILRHQDAEYREAEYRDAVAGRREVVVSDPLYMTPRETGINDLDVLRGVPPTGARMLTASSGIAVSATESYMQDRGPYHAYRYGASSVDTFLPPPGREEVPASSYYADNRRDGQHPDTDLLRRMENDHLAQLYIKYAVDAPPSNYSQLPRYPEVQREPVPSSVQRELVPTNVQRETLPTSVSSRYSFAGPSLSYR